MWLARGLLDSMGVPDLVRLLEGELPIHISDTELFLVF
jgi:hypothetical protein